MKQLKFKNTFEKDLYFNIEEIKSYASKSNPVSFNHHSHDYYVIIVIREGTGVHNIDFNQYTIQPNSIFFLSPNQVHQITETEQHKGFVISFNHGFLMKSGISPHFFENINLFKALGDSPPLLPEEGLFIQLTDYCKEMLRCFEEENEFKYDALGSVLKLFLIKCNSVCDLAKAKPGEILDNALFTIRKFKDHVEQYHSELHKASQYAEKLHISPNYLNKLVKTYLHSTTKEYIQNRIILAAKRKIWDSDLTVKEIAYELGFSDPSGLSKMFKQCTTKSLSEFKESMND